MAVGWTKKTVPAVTINTDNRLVAGTTMTREMSLLVEEAGYESAR